MAETPTRMPTPPDPHRSTWDRMLAMVGIEPRDDDADDPANGDAGATAPPEEAAPALAARGAGAPAEHRVVQAGRRASDLHVAAPVSPAPPAPAPAPAPPAPRRRHFRIASWTKLIGVSAAFLAAVSSLLMAFTGVVGQLLESNIVPSRGCGAPAQVLVFDVRPQDVQRGGTAQVTIALARATAWRLASAHGSTFSQVQGSVPGSGSVTTTYRADTVGRDTLTLTVTPQDRACEVDVRTATVVVAEASEQ